MDRRVSAHFHVIRINRWSLVVALVIALAILLFPFGSRPASTDVAPTGAVVRQGVTMLNRDFSGKTENEARAMLKEMASAYQVAPIAAREGRDENGVSYVIPEANGYSLDIDTTWFRLATAAGGSRIEPAAHIHQPAKRIADYPLSAIRKGNGNKKAIALLINVDWGERELPSMLATMKKRAVKATFFLSGRWAEKFPTLVKRIASEGHEVATHGYSLTYGPTELARAGQLMDDIAKSVKAIEAITGKPVRYYAPHMSEVDETILKTAADLKLRTVLYSLDTVDWKDSTSGDMILDTFRQAMPGDLILLHPKPNTAKVLDTALQQFLTRGLRPITLTEVLDPQPDSPAGAWHTPHEPN